MNIHPRIPAAGWIHAQSWALDQQRPANSDNKRRRRASSKHSKRVPKPDMDDQPPPVPPKDPQRSPTSEVSPLDEQMMPAPLRPSPRQPQHSTTPNAHLNMRHQPGSSYTSYTYPPSTYGTSVEATSAPSTRTEFADAGRSIPSWHRASELFLPAPEGPLRRPTTERPTSPSGSQRTVSTLRRSVSSYSAADHSPSIYSPSVHSPQAALDLSRTPTFRSQSTWIGPSPISPQENREHWTQTSYSPRNEDRRGSSWTPSEEPFEDASQFHLFVEATAGLGPLDNNNGHRQRSILSPMTAQSSLSGPSHEPQFLSLGLDMPRASSVPPQLPQEFYAPRVVHSQMQRRQTHQHSRSREAQQVSEAFAEALTGFGPEGQVCPSDELPDYAQSQREAQQRQRRAAAQRAQELEQRWARARRAAQARGQ